MRNNNDTGNCSDAINTGTNTDNCSDNINNVSSDNNSTCINSKAELNANADILADEYISYTIGLALFDMIPVLLFLMSGLIMCSLYDSRLLMAGVAMSFAGGTCKVIWKVIIAVHRRNIMILTRSFRPLLFGGMAIMLLSVMPGVGHASLTGMIHGLTSFPAVVFFLAGLAGLCLMGWLGAHMDKSARSNWIEEGVNTAAQTAILIGLLIVYLGTYYHGNADAYTALETSEDLSVTEIDEGYYFDGSGTDAALVFYPGAKVEAEAYAPLMRLIAQSGTDCFLCRMPCNLALLDRDIADEIKARYGEVNSTGDDQGSGAGSSSGENANDYSRWYIAGHSLGGATAAMLLSAEDDWDGLILLAAYPTSEVNEPMLSVYGSEEEVLNMDRYTGAVAGGYMPDDFTEHVIDGGNHAGFGSYGEQDGDGAAAITARDQQEQTADIITNWITER